MLAIVVPFVFTAGAIFAVASIALTMRAQWSGAVNVVRMAYEVERERRFLVRYPQNEVRTLLPAELPRLRDAAGRSPITRRSVGSLPSLIPAAA